MIKNLQELTFGAVATYANVEIQKDQILEENKHKGGIYRFTNITNKKTYVGSATDLRARFYVYYSAKRLESSRMVIYIALKKYGYSNFMLEILEYCPENILMEREQYYLDLLKPEYNILSLARSSLGYKHTVEAKEKISKGRSAYTGYELSAETRAKIAVAATGRVLSDEAKAKISAARVGIKLSDETRAKISAATFKPFGSNRFRQGCAKATDQVYSIERRFFDLLETVGGGGPNPGGVSCNSTGLGV